MTNISSILVNDIKSSLEEPLKKAGMFYRIFARSKSADSTSQKLAKKRTKYIANHEKMQDIIGIRIIFYFIEDVEIYHGYLKKYPNFISESNSAEEMDDKQKLETFAPIRLNLIFRMNSEESKQLKEELDGFVDIQGKAIDTNFIDNTYEVQLRTVLSEGWHEVEHDLRYKCKEASWWKSCQQESRMLNGIYAALETNEHALEFIFDKIAYKNYKGEEWDAMIRNHYRLRILTGCLSQKLADILSKDHDVAKDIIRYERGKLQLILLNWTTSYPITMDNITYLVNRLTCSNSDIRALEPEIIMKKLNDFAR